MDVHERAESEISDDEVPVEIDRISAMRQACQDVIERILAEVLDDQSFQELSLIGLRVRRQRLVSNFEAFEQNNILYRQRFPIATNETYLRLEREMMTALELIDTRVNHEERNVVQVAESTAQPVQVIKIEAARRPQLTKFNGSPSEWPAFRDLFLAEVHNKDMESVQKLLYLQGACTGKASKTLGQRPQQTMSRRSCVVPGCDATHPVYVCETFKRLTLPERVTIVRQARLCQCCLNPGHFAQDCQRGTCTLCPENPKKYHIRLCEKSLFNYQAGHGNNIITIGH